MRHTGRRNVFCGRRFEPWEARKTRAEPGTDVTDVAGVTNVTEAETSSAKDGLSRGSLGRQETSREPM
jgi:hypothetical protein